METNTHSSSVKDGLLQVLVGDCRETLKTLPDGCCQTCVTSPPYWGLRDYGHPGQIGQEATPQEYVATMVQVFGEVGRVLRDDGTLWLNLGDSYCSQGGSHDGRADNQPGVGAARIWRNGAGRADGIVDARGQRNRNGNAVANLKAKDLIGIPWMTAFAMRDAGWYLRQEIIWAKPNPMPESVTDRCTRSHEQMFMFAKQPKYYYDAAAIREQPTAAMVKQVEEGYNGKAIKDYLGASVQDASKTKSRIIDQARKRIDKQRGHSRRHAGFNEKWDALTPAEQALLGANKRDVWTVAPANYREAHFATFPPALIRPCILAGSPAGGTVLDPFGGSFTTAAVAIDFGRKAIVCELNEDYVALGRARCNITPGLPL